MTRLNALSIVLTTGLLATACDTKLASLPEEGIGSLEVRVSGYAAGPSEATLQISQIDIRSEIRLSAAQFVGGEEVVETIVGVKGGAWEVRVELTYSGGCTAVANTLVTVENGKTTRVALLFEGERVSDSEGPELLCDGVDNDCDGMTDEGFDIGGACEDGVGACHVEGQLRCNAAGDGVECSNSAGTGGPEQCNDIDDDCDGMTDEDLEDPSPDAAGPCEVRACDPVAGWQTTAVADDTPCGDNGVCLSGICQTEVDECALGTHDCPSRLDCIDLEVGFECASDIRCGDAPCGMVSVPSGVFFQGCAQGDPDCEEGEDDGDGTGRNVTLRAFLIDRTEVTVAQYAQCVADGDCEPADTAEDCDAVIDGREQHPVACTNWEEAAAFCAWAGKRLPTEAEWEKAARGTDGRLYPWGDEPADCSRAVMSPDGAWGCGSGATFEPCSRSPEGDSPYGLCDMAGNVMEWVADRRDINYYATGPQVDPPGPISGFDRVFRGGSLHDQQSWQLRTSGRGATNPDFRLSYLGFRCARDIPLEADVDLCEVDASGNNGCGVASQWACTHNPGAPPTCVDVDECALGRHDCPADIECINGDFGYSCARDLDCGGEPCGMLPVPGSVFFMGCREGDPSCKVNESDGDGTGRLVTLSPFLIDRTEVTVAQYTACVAAGACEATEVGSGCNAGVAGREQHPINCTSWEDADAYCQWVGKQLPTEAQWEKAARGTDARLYPWGDEAPDCSRVIMDDGNTGCGTGATGPVCSRSPAGDSPYGACDLAGNVFEWVADTFEAAYYESAPSIDPTGPAAGPQRVNRGGSWIHPSPVNLRASNRDAFPFQEGGHIGLGFRCAKAVVVDPTADRCEVSEGHNGCGLASAWDCVNNPGSAPSCSNPELCTLGLHSCDSELDCIPRPGGFECASQRMCGDELCAMVQVPAGEFFMGCREDDMDCEDNEDDGDGTGRNVTLSAYLIDRVEVTVAQYAECVADGACEAANATADCSAAVDGRDSHPVVCTDWSEASAYCAWAGKRLPTEAEWEKAARGTDGRLYPWGDEEADCSRAVVNETGDWGCGTRDTFAPCSRSPEGDSPYGLCDMAGNVMEWVADFHDANYYATGPATDPQGPAGGFDRVFRGGNLHDRQSWQFRSSGRGVTNPNFRFSYLGFRCAEDIER